MGHKGNQINMEREDVDKGKEKDNEAKAEHAKNPYEVSDNELEKTMAKEAREERRKEERRVALRRESDRAALEERESVLRENEQLKDEIKSMKDTMLRRQADFENYKKRAARQQGEIRKMAIRDFAGEIIQINDDLLRAVEASEKLNADASAFSFSEASTARRRSSLIWMISPAKSRMAILRISPCCLAALFL